MKQIFKICIGLYVLAMAQMGCGRRSEPYVANERRVIDSVYATRHDSIQTFFDSIKWVNQLPALQLKLVTVEDSTDITNKDLQLIRSINEVPYTDSLKITTDNFVLINNKTNLSSWGVSDSVLGMATTPYFISQFDGDPQGISGITPFDRIPEFFYYHNKAQSFLSDYHKLTADQIAPTVERSVQQIRSIQSIRYLVVLSDLWVSMPQLMSDSTFESGELISQVQLFDKANHRLISQQLLYSHNSDEVQHLFVGITGELKQQVLKKRLMEDFCASRNEAILKLFKITE